MPVLGSPSAVYAYAWSDSLSKLICFSSTSACEANFFCCMTDSRNLTQLPLRTLHNIRRGAAATMPTPELRSEARPVRVILDVEGAREVGPTESAGLVRSAWPSCTGSSTPRSGARWTSSRRHRRDGMRRRHAIAAAVRRERGKFFTRFRSEFDQIFAARRAGKPRARLARTQAGAALALVDERDHAGQVALKDAVQAMRVAVREEGFGFDLRARIVMREAASAAEFDNPFGAELVCDALGNTCRALWAANGLWRPIMERIVRVLTPAIVALHRDLNDLLQDRDILPVLRVRTRKHSGASTAEDSGGLYRKVASSSRANRRARPRCRYCLRHARRRAPTSLPIRSNSAIPTAGACRPRAPQDRRVQRHRRGRP